MATNQPEWELIANLGDVNPIDYGGYFIYRDKTGVYVEEGVMLLAPQSDTDKQPWTEYRVMLERCTLTDAGILSDNKYHPHHPAWFANPEEEMVNRPQDTTYLSRVADYVSLTLYELQKMFCSLNPVERAHAYEMVGGYHGFLNFDEAPLNFHDRGEIEERYKDEIALLRDWNRAGKGCVNLDAYPWLILF